MVASASTVSVGVAPHFAALVAMCIALGFVGCGDGGGANDGGGGYSGTGSGSGTGGAGGGGPRCAELAEEAGADPFADEVITFTPVAPATFGHDKLPDIVLGPPKGSGATAGSFDVASLGEGGVIVLKLTDVVAIDGPGIDLIVFENAFSTWIETGRVSASEDGVTWHEWPCDPTVAGAPGCAGVHAVLSHPDNGIDPTDPEAAGGDGFDLAELGLDRAAYIRIEDTGTNTYGFASGGFDLDAIALVHCAVP